MSLQSLLESEIISDDLKIEMLTRVAENLEIPITEELLNEWQLNFPGGRKLSYTKEPEKDTHDAVLAIYDKPAKAKEMKQPQQPQQKAPDVQNKPSATPQPSSKSADSSATTVGQSIAKNAGAKNPKVEKLQGQLDRFNKLIPDAKDEAQKNILQGNIKRILNKINSIQNKKITSPAPLKK